MPASSTVVLVIINQNYIPRERMFNYNLKCLVLYKHLKNIQMSNPIVMLTRLFAYILSFDFYSKGLFKSSMIGAKSINGFS